MPEQTRVLSTEERQELIREVLRKGPFKGSQLKLGEEVQRLARERNYGVDTSQPTISRDLRQMGISRDKDTKGYLLKETEALPDQRESLQMFLEWFGLRLERETSPIVVQTEPGHAQGTATYVRGTFPESVLGTLTGDNIVLVFAVPEKKDEVFEEMSAMLGASAPGGGT